MKSLHKCLLLASGAVIGLHAGVSNAETVLSVTQYAYDSNGRLDCQATRMNPSTYGALPANACNAAAASNIYGPDRITHNVYDPGGRLTQTLQAYGVTADQRTYATYNYSANGQVVDAIDANGNRTHNQYDGFDRLKEIDYPSPTRPTSYNPATLATALATAGTYNTVVCNTTNTADCEAYTYDANNNRLTERRRDKRVVTVAYDNLNRPNQTTVSDGSIAPLYVDYDLGGHPCLKAFTTDIRTLGPDCTALFTNTTAGVHYQYDALGRVTSTKDVNGRAIAYAYNQASSKTRVVYPDGVFADYGSGASGYDRRDAMERVNLSYLSDGWALFQLVYNSLGQVTTLGRGPSLAGGTSTFTYDGVGRVATIANNTDGTATTYDITWTFGYNPASQVTSLGTSSNAFDYKEYTSSTVNQTYDGLNRDAGVAAISGGYDARGNLTKEGTTNAFGGSGRVFTYDIYNRLLSVAANGTPTSPVVTMVYDPEGRLASFTDSSGVTTTLLYDGAAMIGEYNGASSTISERYVHGPGTDQPLVWYHGSGTGGTYRRYFYTNYQGSVISYVNVSGVTQETYQYGPYGEPEINRANPATTNPWSTTSARFRYTGQTMLFASSGVRLYNYKARVYDPMYGHFLQTDPIGSKDDLGLYNYTHGDPVNLADSTGFAPNQKGATSSMTVENELKQYMSLREISDAHIGNTDRYFYTEKFGWIDIRHFARAAADVLDGTWPVAEEAMGFGNEVYQGIDELGDKNGYKSSFSPEDLPSNKAGAQFGEFARKEMKRVGDGENWLWLHFAVWASNVGAKDLWEAPVSRLPVDDPSGNGGTERGSNVTSAPKRSMYDDPTKSAENTQMMMDRGFF